MTDLSLEEIFPQIVSLLGKRKGDNKGMQKDVFFFTSIRMLLPLEST